MWPPEDCCVSGKEQKIHYVGIMISQSRLSGTTAGWDMTAKHALAYPAIRVTRPLILPIGTEFIAKCGWDVSEYEADAMKFIGENTTIPVPRVLEVVKAKEGVCILMTRIPGIPLSQHITQNVDRHRLAGLCEEVSSMVSQLRSLDPELIVGPGHSRYMGSITQVCTDKADRPLGGPPIHFPIENRVSYELAVDLRMASEDCAERLKDIDLSITKLVLTHGDLAPCNIMVHDGHVSGIIDWGALGTYPPSWEREAAMSSCGTLSQFIELVKSYC